MSDEKFANKKDDKCDELINIDDMEIEEITGGVCIGGIEYSTHTVSNEFKRWPRGS